MLAFCAVVPAMLLIWAGALFERQRTLEVAHERVLELARVGAEQQDDIIQEAENLLRVLARIPTVSTAAAGQCHALLQSVADDHPRIDSITITDRSGAANCNSQQEQPNFSVGDRGYFRSLMVPNPPAFAVSELVFGKLSGRPTVVAAVPLPISTTDGLPQGVALASLSLDWFARLAHRLPEAETHTVLVVDLRDGTVLTSTDNSQALIGKRFPDHPLLQAFRHAAGGSVVDAVDFMGTEQIFGFAPLPGTHGNMIVAVGLTRDTVLGAANQRFLIELVLSAAVACAAMLLASFAAHVWLLQPGAAIVSAVHAFGMGDMKQRIATEDFAVIEMHRLAMTFNAMADAIEEHEQQLAVAHAALADSEEHHRTLAENATDMITRLSADFSLVYVSPACLTLLGYTPDELKQMPPQALIHPDDVLMLQASLEAPLRQGVANARASYRSRRKDGSVIWLETSGQRLHDAPGYVLVTRDISERKHFEASLEKANSQLEFLARQDALTGLANRRHFDEMLETEWRRAAREAAPLALLMIDVDRFKMYNDTFGHPAGDECLRAVAGAISAVLRRPADLAARYGGEEIAVILPNTDSEGAGFIAERVCEAVRSLRIAHPANESALLTISVGAAMCTPKHATGGPASGAPTQDLLTRADMALYEAKHGGRNTVRRAPDDTGPPLTILVQPDTKMPPRVIARG